MDETSRKKKEKLGFMVRKFLSAYDTFNDIYFDFEEITSTGNSLVGHGLHNRVKKLEEGLFYDVKDFAHSLFRENSKDKTKRQGKIKVQSDKMYGTLETLLPSDDPEKVHSVISNITIEGIKERLDQTIGQSFHELMILRENLYLLEEYEPRYKTEQGHSKKIRSIAERKGYEFSEEENRELFHLDNLDVQNKKEIEEAKADITTGMHKLKDDFERISELLKHYIPRIKDETTLSILSKTFCVIKEIIGGEKRIGLYGEKKAEELYSAIKTS